MQEARRRLKPLIPLTLVAALTVPIGSAQAGVSPATPTGTWTPVMPTGPAIPGRAPQSQLVYDPAHHEFVVFSSTALTADGDYQLAPDTWTSDGTRWTRRAPETSPPQRFQASMAYDPALGRTVLFGGDEQVGDLGMRNTWTFDGTQWRQVHPAAAPAPRSGAAMAYDPVSRRLILFGGYEADTPDRTYPDGFDDTWAFDGTTWTRLHPAHTPPSGVGLTAATGNHLVLYAGSRQDQPTRSQTWEWTGSDWQRKPAAANPPSRWGAAMAGDGSHVLMVGGYGTDPSHGAGELSDVWEWDGQTWTQVATDAGPGARFDAGLAATAPGRFTLFGGQDFAAPTQLLGDSWNLQLGQPGGAAGSSAAVRSTRAVATRSDAAAQQPHRDAETVLNTLRPASAKTGATATGADPAFAGYDAPLATKPGAPVDLAYTMTVPSLACTEPAALEAGWQLGVVKAQTHADGAAIEQWCEGTHPGYALQMSAESQWIYRAEPLAPGERLRVRLTSTDDALTIEVRSLTNGWVDTGVFAPESEPLQGIRLGDEASAPPGGEAVAIPTFRGQRYSDVHVNGRPLTRATVAGYAMVPAYGGPIQITPSPLTAAGFSPLWSAN